MSRPTIARLCMRTVGDQWVAYIAGGPTMDDAVEIGSIRLFDVLASPETRRSFLRMMKAKARQAVETSMKTQIEFRGGRSA